MRQVTDRALWVGHVGDLLAVGAIMSAGIEAIIELADNEQFTVLPRELVRGRFPLSDGGDNPLWLLRLAADTVAVLLKAEVPVLVCCSAGMSRSLCVAAGGLVLNEGLSLPEALSIVVGNGPADVSPGVLVQMQAALTA